MVIVVSKADAATVVVDASVEVSVMAVADASVEVSVLVASPDTDSIEEEAVVTELTVPVDKVSVAISLVSLAV
jgi:hypothetical protein